MALTDIIKRRKVAVEKILDVDASMQGLLSFKDPVNLKINGKFEGTLETKGNLTISQGAEVKADISGENISIAGKVTGKIIAKGKLFLARTATVSGDINPIKLEIEEGAILEGNCKMLNELFNADELSRYLEIEKDSVLEWARSGKIPAIKDGPDWKFERRIIDDWVANERT
ncbi:MAG: polymer-forming cytoskeletal protein [Candidatus Omnitrophota bacterium]